MTIDNINHRVQLSVNDFTYESDGSIKFTNLKCVHNQAASDYPNMELVYPSFPNNEIRIVVDNNIPITLGEKTDFNNQTLRIIRNSSYQGDLFLFQLLTAPISLGYKVGKKLWIRDISIT